MLLTITNTTSPATDMGYLLHKHPASVRSAELAFGSAHVFYPEASLARTTVALLCEVDPVALVRRSRTGPFPLAPYVNDRPYAASSFLSVAVRALFSSAMRGQCRERPDLLGQALDLTARLPVLPSRDGEEMLHRLFGPLGYTVSAQPLPLDPGIPAWGASPYFGVTLSARCHIRDLLGHLYVLLPVLDDGKHYWVTRDEITKLADSAGEWLATHPERETVIRRYLRHQPDLVEEATARLLAADDVLPSGGDPAEGTGPTGGAWTAGASRTARASGGTGASGDAVASGTTVAREGAGASGGAAVTLDGTADWGPGRPRLREARIAAVLAALTEQGAQRVLDLGCGDGRLLAALLADPRFQEVVGVDASAADLGRAARRLRVDEMTPRQRGRVRLLQGGLTYTDRRLAGYDAAVLMEVIEHLDPARLDSVAGSVFGAAAPRTVVVTTPNADFNVRYPGLAPGGRRHPDHRFEWGRREFEGWAGVVASRYGYRVRCSPVGPADEQAGSSTQMAVLTRDGAAAEVAP